MGDARDPDESGWVSIGPLTWEGKAPWFAPWVYVVPVVGSALWVGLAGPYVGWRAGMAAVVVAGIVYVAMTVVVITTGVLLAAFSGWRRGREYKRDPRAFIEKRFGRRWPPDTHLNGPPGPAG